MEEAIRKFGSQFDFSPVIENESKFELRDSSVLSGMGGSHLSAGLLKIFNPALDLYIHRDYGLPPLSEKRFRSSLFIASSYSGNTEEVLDFAEKARAKKYNLAVITIGGKLLDFAKKNKIPYIQLPDSGIQPRSAMGFSLLALAQLVEGDDMVTDLKQRGSKLDVAKWEKTGTEFASGLKGKIPVIYSSRTNLPIAYNWKIKFNETAKIPAFYNNFPELNHNEMAGFDHIPSTKDLSEKFHFIFLDDPSDHPKIMHRAQITKKLYADRGLAVTTFQISGDTVFEKSFNSLILADWITLNVSKMYGTVPDKVQIVEELKKLMI